MGTVASINAVPTATAKEAKEVMVQYLLLKVSQEDWHGVMDAAADLREMEVRDAK